MGIDRQRYRFGLTVNDPRGHFPEAEIRNAQVIPMGIDMVGQVANGFLEMRGKLKQITLLVLIE